jgi:hypothetical protein
MTRHVVGFDPALDRAQRGLPPAAQHVLERHAWKMAAELGWPDSWTAEPLALTQLQADAFVTLDADLARSAARGAHGPDRRAARRRTPAALIAAPWAVRSDERASGGVVGGAPTHSRGVL